MCHQLTFFLWFIKFIIGITSLLIDVISLLQHQFIALQNCRKIWTIEVVNGIFITMIFIFLCCLIFLQCVRKSPMRKSLMWKSPCAEKSMCGKVLCGRVLCGNVRSPSLSCDASCKRKIDFFPLEMKVKTEH